MRRDTTLARVVVIAGLAVAITIVALNLASSGDRSSSGGRRQSAASAQGPSAGSEATTEAAPPKLTKAGASPSQATSTAPVVAASTVPATTAPPASAAAAQVPATTVPPTTAAAAPPTPVPGGAIAIGDSVLEDVALYAPSTLSARGVVVNAAVSRQWAAGETLLASMKAAGSLPAVVVVALGTNGPITSADFDQMMSNLAGRRRVVFMTVTGPLIANNDVIRAGVARYPDAVLADWASLAAAHPTWFARDHVHIGAAGATALGQLFASVI
jgi:hypothetical protein